MGRAAALSFLIAAVTCIFIGYAFTLLAWLIIRAAVVVFAPAMATRMGDGLVRTLGLAKPGPAGAGRATAAGPDEAYG